MGQAMVRQFGLIYCNHLHYLSYEVREEKVGVDMVNPNPVQISIPKSQNKNSPWRVGLLCEEGWVDNCQITLGIIVETCSDLFSLTGGHVWESPSPKASLQTWALSTFQDFSCEF
jgi:hypothetical protein